MNDDALFSIRMMAQKVTEDQDCVLQLIIGETGMIAQLIPLDAWEEDDWEEE